MSFLLNLMDRGGPWMWVLLTVLILGLAIVAERAFALFRPCRTFAQTRVSPNPDELEPKKDFFHKLLLKKQDFMGLDLLNRFAAELSTPSSHAVSY